MTTLTRGIVTARGQLQPADAILLHPNLLLLNIDSLGRLFRASGTRVRVAHGVPRGGGGLGVPVFDPVSRTPRSGRQLI